MSLGKWFDYTAEQFREKFPGKMYAQAFDECESYICEIDSVVRPRQIAEWFLDGYDYPEGTLEGSKFDFRIKMFGATGVQLETAPDGRYWKEDFTAISDGKVWRVE